MAHVQDLGTRVELLSMDKVCGDISIGLYIPQDAGPPVYRVHTYSRKPGAADRVAFIREAMKALAGMTEAGEGLLAFPCGHGHLLACRRAFLEACKLDGEAGAAPRPLTTVDRKSGLEVRAQPEEDGRYRVVSEGEADTKARRLAAIGNGLAKLGEMELLDDVTVRFPCGQGHDALVGLLLVRAPNVRSVIREEAAAASRGVLSAPSQQAES